MQLRILKKKDGSEVLQYSEDWQARFEPWPGSKEATISKHKIIRHWQDVPVVEEGEDEE